MDKDHPIVLRMEARMPASLGAMQMHANRSGGDLDHCDIDRKDQTIWYEEFGERNFAKAVKDEIAEMSQSNLVNALEAMDKNRRFADHAKRKKEGGKPPYREAENGPLREVILTANAQYFYADPDDPDPYRAHRTTKSGDREIFYLSRNKIEEFKRMGLEFFAGYFPGQVRHLRLDMDEEVPHFHALIMVTKVTNSKRRGKQINIVPSANPLIANYEHAQDVAGAYFACIGLVRGERRAEARRNAKALGDPLPEDRDHVTPAEHRAARAEAILLREVDAEYLEEAAQWEAEQTKAAAVADADQIRQEADAIRDGAKRKAEEIRAEALEAKQEADARLAAMKGIADGTIIADLTNAEEPFKVVKDADSDKAKPLLTAIKTSPKAAIDATKALRAAFRPLKNKLDAQLAAIKWVSEEWGTVDPSRKGNEFRVAENTDKETADTLLSRIRLAPKAALGAVMPLVNILKRTKQAENSANAASAAVLAAAEGLFDFDADKTNDDFIALNRGDPEKVKVLEARMNLDKRLASTVGRAINATINRAVKDKTKKAEEQAKEAENRWNMAYEQIAGIMKSARDYMHPSNYDKFRRKAALVVNNADLQARGMHRVKERDR